MTGLWMFKRYRDAAKIVAEQAEDEGLWFRAKTAPEAYLQQELRRLHAAIEDHVDPGPAPAPFTRKAETDGDSYVEIDMIDHIHNIEPNSDSPFVRALRKS